MTGGLLAYFHMDYDWRGLLLILVFYLFRNDSLLQTIFGGLVMSTYGFTGALFAFLVINAYNGRRGFIKVTWESIWYICFIHSICLYCGSLES